MKREIAFDMLPKRIDAVLVVGLGSGLTLINVEFKPEIKVTAIKNYPVSNEIRDENIAQAISNFVQENNIQHKNAILNLATSSVFVKRIQLPAMPDSELPEAIAWQIKAQASFDLAKACLDYEIVKEVTKEDGARIFDIMCIAAPELEIKSQVMEVKKAGFECRAVIPLLFGYTKLVKKYYLRDNKETIAVLHIGEEKSNIAFHKDSNLEFYRELPISINKLREVLSGTMISDKGKIQLTPSDIEDILFSRGILMDEAFVYKDKMGGGQILAMLRPTLERLKAELERSLTYYTSQLKGSIVNNILLSGLALRIPNVDKFLNKELSLNIQKISLRDKIKFAPEVNLEILEENAALFGLALDYEHGINLMPREFRLEK